MFVSVYVCVTSINLLHAIYIYIYIYIYDLRATMTICQKISYPHRRDNWPHDFSTVASPSEM